MRKYAALLIVALATVGMGAIVLFAQSGGSPTSVSWAYGFVTVGPDPIPPPCTPETKPHDCARPGRPWPEDGIQLRLPDTERTFTIAQIQSYWDPADWYPGDHPPVPDIVQHGNQSDHVRACAHCHYHNGQGKPENAHLAGLPVNYFIQQMALFKSGGRKGADPRKANMNEMAQMPRFMSDEDIKAAAEYYALIPWKPWIRVVESNTAPKTRQSPAGLFIPLPGSETEPLGQRIIEVPEKPDNTERLRDPRSGFVAYVPVGSIAKGKELVTTGGAGKTIQCAVCHGEDLTGIGDTPAIADRSASYNMRQLYNYQQGTRQSLLMKPVVEKLDVDDMIAIVAYLASL
jgi:cytochrome c553